MPAEFLQAIEDARKEVLAATPNQLYAISPTETARLRMLELSTEQLRLSFDPALRPAADVKALKDQGLPTVAGTGAGWDAGPLVAPPYPNLNWAFNFSDPGEPEEDDTSSGSGSGKCAYPGISASTRFNTLTTAVILEAVKDIAEQACGQDILGENTGLLCVVTDIAAYIAIGINENQELCNDFVTAAEVTATWNGIQTVHGNLQHVHGDLEGVDSDLAQHDSDIKSLVSTHDSDLKTLLATHDGDIKTQLTTHDTEVQTKLDALQGGQVVILENQETMIEQLELIIRLLNTPQGRRPEFPTASAR